MKPVARVVFIGTLAALTLASQVAISFLPNIELVSLLFIIYANKLNKKDAFLVVLIFSILEGLVWGFGDWVIGYLWIWPLEMLLATLCKPLCKENNGRWAIFSACWGLLFGILFSLQHAVLYSLTAGYAYWLKGLVFDVIHASGNYVICIALYKPLSEAFSKLYRKLKTYENIN